eukprot:CAMPEP_0206227964 /NCGR_PEP_ID=MMETSP0047_2-20121206/8911_1 /ASSEMBLY_ACC=CAM_ASM_000192 /TAXON_ID=195065 /ORGANISM="Chroomonas mesostigmatica_cf, Strain CCMP1168" /LENGTH=446 /DNA_ID=CAMNT_0053651165 /DNA_START=94 /DNA_END=1435 /DNA_ORIENTATION=-
MTETAGVAHVVVNRALDLTAQTVDWGKSKPGILKAVIERVEGPVNATLGTTAVKTVIKVGDRVLTTVDKSIESTMNTSYYKSGEAFVKSQYSNRIVPATNTVTTTVATTTSRITTPVINTYSNVLIVADRQVEYYLPDAEGLGKELPLTAVGITRKVGKRTVKRAKAAKKYTVAKVGNMANATKKTLRFAFEQAKPSNIKKNTVKAYVAGFDMSDKMLDKYLPSKGDALVAKGPVSLVQKATKRIVVHSIAQVKAAATAIKNSPTTFKKAVNTTIAGAKVQLARLQKMSVEIRFKSYDTLLPYINAAQARSLALIQATDRLLLKYPLTTYVRNFAVKRYDGLVAPIVAKLIKPAAAKPATPKKEAPPMPAVEAPPAQPESGEGAVAGEDAVAPDEEAVAPVPEPVEEEVAEPEAEEEMPAERPPSVEGGGKKKSKKNKKKDAAAYC